MKKKFISTLSLILCFVLICSSLVFAVSADSDELSVIVASDLHYNPKSSIQSIKESATVTRYPMFSHVTRNGLMYCESEAILKSFLESVKDTDAKYLLIPGDLVDEASESGHNAIAKVLRSFEASSGKQVYVSPGNHDLYNEFPLESFRRIYNDFGYSQSIAIDEATGSYAADLGDGYRLLAINSESNNTGISGSLLSWMQGQISDANAAGKNVIVMMHRGLLHHMKSALSDKILDLVLSDRVSNADAVWQLFADMGVKYIFTGHAHANDITSAISAAGNQIFDIETGSLIGYSSPYRIVNFSPSGVEITTKNISKINPADLPAGYTPQQLELITNDFLSYSKGVLGASAYYECRLITIDDPMIIPFKMGLSEDNDLVKLMHKVFPKVYDAFCLPLYKTESTNGNSLEEFAESCGGSIPKSGYTDIYDVVADILAAHIAGDENIAGDSVEIKLIWSCAKAAFVKALDGLEDEYEKAVAKLPFAIKYSSIRNFATKLAFRQSVVNELLSVIVAPYIEGVTVDDFNPADVNVILPPFSAKPEIKTRWNEFVDLIKSVKEYLIRIFAVLKQAIISPANPHTMNQSELP